MFTVDKKDHNEQPENLVSFTSFDSIQIKNICSLKGCAVFFKVYGYTSMFFVHIYKGEQLL